MVFICTGTMFTAGCGAILTDHEREYYDTTCEKCAREYHERIQAWCAGGEDRELDKAFGCEPNFSNRN